MDAVVFLFYPRQRMIYRVAVIKKGDLHGALNPRQTFPAIGFTEHVGRASLFGSRSSPILHTVTDGWTVTQPANDVPLI